MTQDNQPLNHTPLWVEKTPVWKICLRQDIRYEVNLLVFATKMLKLKSSDLKYNAHSSKYWNRVKEGVYETMQSKYPYVLRDMTGEEIYHEISTVVDAIRDYLP